MIHEFAAAVS